MKKKFVIMPRPKPGVPPPPAPTKKVKVRTPVTVTVAPTKALGRISPAATVSLPAPVLSKVPITPTPTGFERLGGREAKGKGFRTIRATEASVLDTRCVVCHAALTETWNHITGLPAFDTEPVFIVIQFPFMSSGRAQRKALCRKHLVDLKGVIDDALESRQLPPVPTPAGKGNPVRPEQAKGVVARGGR